MSFTRLFVHFNDCRDTARLEISADDRVFIHSWDRILATASETVGKVIGLLRKWQDFMALQESKREEIERELQASADPDCNTISVGKIRSIYHRVIAEQLEGFEKAACIHCDHPSRRIVSKWNGKEIVVLSSDRKGMRPIDVEDENSETAGKFRKNLVVRYGASRVERIIRGHADNLHRKILRGEPLLVEDVMEMISGLVDFHDEDLQEGYEKIKAVLSVSKEHLRERALEKLPEQMRYLIGSSNQAIVDKLDHTFGCPDALPTFYTELEPAQIKFLIGLTAIPYKDLEKTLLGKRVEGVVEGSFPLFSYYSYFYSKLVEDRGRIQAIQEVMGHGDNNELFFLEMWAKLFVKKEVSKAYDLHTGLIVPAPGGEWYRIEHKESSHGKFVLCLEPVTNRDLPSYIMQRSTALSPAASNHAWSIVQDTNPFAPPGYYNKKACLETEFMHFYGGENDLVISGHSLGGSFTQLNMINFIKKIEKDTEKEFPKRNIKLVMFDSPAITEKDALYFAKWAKEHPEEAKRITIEYYFSKTDVVPGAGRYHLGVGCEGTGVTVKFVLAETKKGTTEPELLLHPHGRFFFRTKETIQDTLLELNDAIALKAYDDQPWRLCLEITRRIVGALVFSLFLLWFALKTIVHKCAKLLNPTDLRVQDLRTKIPLGSFVAGQEKPR